MKTIFVNLLIKQVDTKRKVGKFSENLLIIKLRVRIFGKMRLEKPLIWDDLVIMRFISVFGFRLAT